MKKKIWMLKLDQVWILFTSRANKLYFKKCEKGRKRVGTRFIGRENFEWGVIAEPPRNPSPLNPAGESAPQGEEWLQKSGTVGIILIASRKLIFRISTFEYLGKGVHGKHIDEGERGAWQRLTWTDDPVA